MNTEVGVAYIITNQEGAKHKEVFERYCSKSISYVKSLRDLPVVVASFGSSDNVKADFYVNNQDYVSEYVDQVDGNALILAEIMKTHICEWSPFDRTIYIDCDAIPIHKDFIDYIRVLDLGFELSITTCVTMAWKDSIRQAPIRSHITRPIPSYYPYWNFGVFGSDKINSKSIMENIRENYFKYAFERGSFMRSGGGTPHAQPAVSQTAVDRSPDHKIFTMPARYNCHFSFGGYVFSGGDTVVLHAWKDSRDLILG